MDEISQEPALVQVINKTIFIQGNAFENVVCKMTAILSWPWCVKLLKLVANNREIYAAVHRDDDIHTNEILMLYVHIHKFSALWYCDANISCTDFTLVCAKHTRFILIINMAELFIWYRLLGCNIQDWIIPIWNHNWRVHVGTHIEADTKWLSFSRWNFQMHFLEWKCMYFDHNFTEVCQIKDILALIEITAWRWPGHMPLPEPMMIILLMYVICATWAQWVKHYLIVVKGITSDQWISFTKAKDAESIFMPWRYLVRF